MNKRMLEQRHSGRRAEKSEFRNGGQIRNADPCLRLTWLLLLLYSLLERIPCYINSEC